MTGLRPRLKYLLGASYPAGTLGVRTLGTRDCHGWRLSDLRLETEDEDIPAWFLHPPEGHAPVPAVVYCHAHGRRYDFGRDELLEGRPKLQGPWAPELVAMGCAALCLEMPCFAARAAPGVDARATAWLWRGGTLFGLRLAEQEAAVSYLAEHPQIDAGRIGAMGFSMGSTHAFWLAALDARVRAAVALCSLADLGQLVAAGGHDGHGLYMTVPNLLSSARTGQIAGLIAPRALFVGAGMEDWATPPDAFAVAQTDLECAYAAAGAPEMLTVHVEHAAGHEETPAMRAAVRAFLARHLIGRPG